MISFRDEFNCINDEEDKSAILGDIIYYKILNLGKSNATELIKDHNKTPEEANRLIIKGPGEVGKITAMLIDKDIFSIEEIIEIIVDPKEFYERCLEAIDLLIEYQNC